MRYRHLTRSQLHKDEKVTVRGNIVGVCHTEHLSNWALQLKTHTHRLDISFRLGVTDIFKFSIIISSGYLRTFEDEICQVVAENRGMWLLPLQKHRKEQDVVVCSEFLLVAKWRHLS